MNKLGFGFLRLPKRDRDFDWETVSRMVDAFLAGGGRYFDTAYTYLDGMSEEGLKRCLVNRHPRESFQIADKLPGYLVKQPEDMRRMFEEQLIRCGVEYFDVYMLHWLNRKNYAIAEKFREFAFLEELKRAGKAKKIGFSYHGDAQLLEQILTAHPETDIVQLQINYLDWDDPGIEAGKCYEAACRHGKEVVVMEPVKGGILADLPGEAEALLKAHAPEDSPASWAIRFAQDLDHVSVVLSGMNSMTQMEDNLRDKDALSDEEREILKEVAKILNRSTAVPCTGCRYCVSHCPNEIAIPDYFAIYNSYCRYPDEDWKMRPVYEKLALTHGRASACIGCGMCESHCPQNISIHTFMPKIAEAME